METPTVCYECFRCDVTWHARVDERIPDVCWMCERNDSSKVYMQCGSPVLYYEPEEAADGMEAARYWEDDEEAS